MFKILTAVALSFAISFGVASAAGAPTAVRTPTAVATPVTLDAAYASWHAGCQAQGFGGTPKSIMTYKGTWRVNWWNGTHSSGTVTWKGAGNGVHVIYVFGIKVTYLYWVQKEPYGLVRGCA